MPLIKRRVYKQDGEETHQSSIDQTCVSVSPTESVSVTVRRAAGIVSRPKISQVASIQNTQRYTAEVAKMIEYRSASCTVPPLAWHVAGPMYPSRPVVRLYSSSILRMASQLKWRMVRNTSKH